MEETQSLSEGSLKVRIPLFPLYSQVRFLLGAFPGIRRQDVLSLFNAITEQTGTPQNPVDWSDPDAWISERLSGTNRDLAWRIWIESKRTINPRHIYGAYLLITSYDLIEPDSSGTYQLTERGEHFRSGDAATIRAIDETEGIPKLLSILSTKPRAKRGDLIQEWGEFLKEYSRFGTPSTIPDTLRRRLVSLAERGLVTKDGMFYSITPEGTAYLGMLPQIQSDSRREVMIALGRHNDTQRERLRGLLSTMRPYNFEHLIRDLLEAMGYEDVTVTKESGDRGVDVVATVQFGITMITEVVQVKRWEKTVQCSTLDQLRGALPYYKAIRGTLITLGRFSSGCKDAALFQGAAPIGLIDGEKLLDLLTEHEIGLRKRPATLYEIDDELFSRDGVERPALEG